MNHEFRMSNIDFRSELRLPSKSSDSYPDRYSEFMIQLLTNICNVLRDDCSKIMPGIFRYCSDSFES